MTIADLITKPSPERRTFFLRVAKRANEMQRDLVKKARRIGPRTFLVRGLILVAACLLLLPLEGKAQAQTVRKSGTPRYSSTRYAPAPRTTSCRRTAGGGDMYKSDPFGYRQTEDLIIPGLGTKRRGAQCTPVRRSGTTATVRGPATYVPKGKKAKLTTIGVGAAEGDFSHYLAMMLEDEKSDGNAGSFGGDADGDGISNAGVSDNLETGDPRRPRDGNRNGQMDALDPGNDSDCDGPSNSVEKLRGSRPMDPFDPGMPLPGVRCDEESSLLPKTGVDLGIWEH